MVNHTENERGETVIAEGSPGSLVRLMTENPDTWFLKMSDSHVETFVQTQRITHACEASDSYGREWHEPAWYLGEEALTDGRTRYWYAGTMGTGISRVYERFYNYEPLTAWDGKSQWFSDYLWNHD